MGACDISFELKGKASKEQIEKAFKAQQKRDREYNGHKEGYTGDFQTVNKVEFHLSTMFKTHTEAFEYCLKVSEKWSTVVAVYYNQSAEIKSKALDKLRASVKIVTQLIRDLKSIPIAKPNEVFKTCSGCKSRLAMQYVKYSQCSLCGVSLRPKSIENRIAKKEEQLKVIQNKIDAIISKENAKQAAKGKNINTLVAGWGAC